MQDDDIEETGAPCPSWCVSSHDDDARGARIHRSARRTDLFRARRRSGESGAFIPGDEQERFGSSLARYDGEDRTWLVIETKSGDPLEIDLADANRWVMLVGSVMVDEDSSVRRRAAD